MQIFGYLFMFAGVAGLSYATFVFVQTRKAQRTALKESLSGTGAGNVFASVPVAEQLKTASVEQVIKLTGEFDDRSVKASVDFHELTQMNRNAPWTKTGVLSKALCLSGGIWIFKIPTRDAGKSRWLKAAEIDTPSLMPFYRGGDTPESKGPARLFKENGQVDPVSYELPRNLTPGVIWEVVDIGAFGPEVSGQTDNVVSGDRLYFVTSKEKNGGRWLLFLDARRGEAMGTGGLFLAEEFEPSVDVMELI